MLVQNEYGMSCDCCEYRAESLYWDMIDQDERDRITAAHAECEPDLDFWVWGTEVVDGETINIVHRPVRGELYYPSNCFPTEEAGWDAVDEFETR